MPELLDGLERLARDSEDPEQLMTLARANGKFVEFLSHYWDALLRRLHAGGYPAKLFRLECDKLLAEAETPSRFLDRLLVKGREWQALGGETGALYAEVQSARRKLEALTNAVRTARDQAPVAATVSADPEEIKRRVREADEKGGWVRRPAGDPGVPK